MLRSITIADLRGIHQGELRDLTPLVVLVGPNNSGKSTVLDAILIGCSPDPALGLKSVLARRAGFEKGEASRWLLWQSRTHQATAAAILVRGDGERVRRVPLMLQQTGRRADIAIGSAGRANRPLIREMAAQKPLELDPLPDIPEVRLVDLSATILRQPLHALYTQVAERGLRQEAKALITEVANDVQDIEILAPEKQPVVYFVFEDASRPEATVGDGLRFLLRQCLELATPQGGIVLLEEPEMHMHPAAIRQSAKAMLAATRRGVQIVLTTHSLDLIDSLLAQADEKQVDELTVYRLQLEKGELKTLRIPGRDASFARTQIEDDLR